VTPVSSLARACLAGAALAAASACSPAAPKQTYVVVLKDLMFGPTPSHARVGDTIEWDNDDLFLHSATSSAGGFDLDLKPGVHQPMPLKTAGTFDFICKYHPGMKGRLVVSP
jgi:plastocyanin